MINTKDKNDISDIFKNSLRIENKLKSIDSIFFNERFSSRIDYKPYFQRNYVWDDEKGTYFIESILLGTEIPPLVLFDNQKKNEVIDGRQRYETIEKFINNKLVLTEDGLHVLKSLAGKTYCDLDGTIRETFEDTKIRILQCSVVNEPHLSEVREDKVKKEIFRRYNSGITPLHKEEIQRAEFIDDQITNVISDRLKADKKIFSTSKNLFLSVRQKKKCDRDAINILLAKIRMLMVLPNVPINQYAKSSKSYVVSKVYHYYKYSNLNDEVKYYGNIVRHIEKFQQKLIKDKSILKDNILLFECLYWGMAILLKNRIVIDDNVIEELYIKFKSSEKKWIGINTETKDINLIFEQTGSHYYKSILNRFRLVSNLFNEVCHVNFEKYLNDKEIFKIMMEADSNSIEQLSRFKIHKADPTSMTIEDIMKKINKQRFIIRPNYQRSEVSNIVKSSYLMESIMLDIKIPPIYIYKRKNGVFEVIDGQQRLLTILGFLGKTYLTDEMNYEKSEKHLFKLKELKILEELNGCTVEKVPEKYINQILDFQIDVVEIDSDKNELFDNIDLFLRLNTKPYPIRLNSFEMWNAYVDKKTVMEIKCIAEENEGKLFKKKDPRMSIEELITSLAFLDYKMKQDIDPFSIVNMYKRNNRINARIKNKADITKCLSNISENNSSSFLKSIESVKLFINKVLILIDGESDKIGNLFASLTLNGGKTDQNFYLLWLMLINLDKNQIRHDRVCYYNNIRNIFEIAQDYDKDIEEFIMLLKNLHEI